MEDKEKDLTIEPFVDEMIFSMDENLFDWNKVSEMSDADPDSREYRRMMRELGISGRFKNKSRKWRSDDDY